MDAGARLKVVDVLRVLCEQLSLALKQLNEGMGGRELVRSRENILRD